METGVDLTQRSRIKQLEKEIAALKEELAQLHGALPAAAAPLHVPDIPVALSGYENRLLYCFATLKNVSVDAARSALYHDCPLDDLPVSQTATISVLISRLRKKLAFLGIGIYNVKGKGWFISKSAQEKLREWYGAGEEKKGASSVK